MLLTSAALSGKGLELNLLYLLVFSTFLSVCIYWHCCSTTHSHCLFVTSLSWYFFALSQVIVFEEQEMDGKIQFTSSPDYGMTVDIEWGQEVRGEGGWWWESSWEGCNWGDCHELSLLWRWCPAATSRAQRWHVSEHDILCASRKHQHSSVIIFLTAVFHHLVPSFYIEFSNKASSTCTYILYNWRPRDCEKQR